MSTTSQKQRTYDQRRDGEKNAKPTCYGHRRGKTHAQTSNSNQPQAFPCLAQPAGVEAHPHLRQAETRRELSALE
jgi:hypothetical protein